MSVCRFDDLGLIDYAHAYDLQMKAVQENIAGGDDRLFLCEHSPVFTLGRMFDEASLLYTRDEIERRGIAIRSVDRGGDVTLHSPGQLIFYPIMNLNRHGKDLRAYLRKMEQVVIALLNDFAILAKGSDDQRGVWIGSQKIASMGIGVKKWVTYHGVGLNVQTDLSLFELIRPCGLNVQMTSLSHITGDDISMDDVKQRVVYHFGRQFDLIMKEDDYGRNYCSRIR